MAISDARRDYYAEITQKIVAALESGPPPWRKPWDPEKAAWSGPLNAVSGHRYRGINTLVLGMASLAMGGGDPRWLSYKQAREKGWQVQRGARATTAIFFKRVELKAGDATSSSLDETRTIPVLRGYPIFHASQVEGIPEYVPPDTTEAPWHRPEAASIILTRSGVQYREGGDRAFYSPERDAIQLPPRPSFNTVEGWAGTLLHELGHATGHPSRLDRDLTARYGSRAYAMEELRAELASAFMGAELGLPGSVNDHAAYLESWLSVLKADKREIFRAAADAQRMADCLLGYHPLYAAKFAGAVQPAVKEPTTQAAMNADEMPAHIRAALARREPERFEGLQPPSPAEAPAPEFRPR